MRLFVFLLMSGLLLADEPVELKIRLTSPINTTLSRKGDMVAGKILEPELYRGGYLEGDILDVRGGTGKRSLLEFQFHTLHFEGKTTPVLSSVTQVSNSRHQPAVDEGGAAIEGEAASTAAKISQFGGGLLNKLSKKPEKPTFGPARLGSKAPKLSLAVGSECTVLITTAPKPEKGK